MIRRLVLVVGLATSLMLGGTVAYASTAIAASGTVAVTITLGAPTPVAGKLVFPFTFTETIAGTMSGTRMGTGILRLDPNTGAVTAMDSAIFKGTVAGSAPGTAWSTVTASGNLSSLAGEFRLSHGKGGLKGVRGHVHFTAHIAGGTQTAPMFAGTYAGTLQLPDDFFQPEGDNDNDGGDGGND